MKTLTRRLLKSPSARAVGISVAVLAVALSGSTLEYIRKYVTSHSSSSPNTISASGIVVEDPQEQDFWNALSKSIELDKEVVDSELSDNTDLTLENLEMEVEMLKSFKHLPFEDADLQRKALAYIEALEKQLNAFECSSADQPFQQFYTSLADRCEILGTLTRERGFMADDLKYQSLYCNGGDFWREYGLAGEKINRDLRKQFEEDMDVSEDGQATKSLINRTEYLYDIIFYLTFYDENMVPVEETTRSFSEIMPGDTYQLDIASDTDYSQYDLSFSIYPSLEKAPGSQEIS